MLFFADRERAEDPRAVAGEIADELERAGRLPGGSLRHAVLAGTLVRAGQLAQGLADAPGAPAPVRRVRAELARIARGLWRSYQAGGRTLPPPARTLDLGGAPRTVTVRRPEGYALYALYPELYALAGRDLHGLPLTCIGIRSIGTGLAAMVAAGASARRLVFDLRPGGHPFAREVDHEALSEALAGGRGGGFAVVDEGPGLTGSTFTAVANALLEAGVPAHRVHLFTSHPGPPGPEAPPRARQLLALLPRHCVLLRSLQDGPGLLSPAGLAADLIGRARVVADLGDGGWRRFLPAGDWPPSTGWMERSKVLLEAADGRRFVARFAGLGRFGEEKLARATALAEAGLGLPPLGLRHGLLIEPWRSAPTLRAGHLPPGPLREALARLLRLEGRRPRSPEDGARPEELARMARVNTAAVLGGLAAETARRLEDLVPLVAAEARPVEVDGRLQPWEWLVLPGGRLLKCDGVDHHAGHELSGCQDLLWDVAGAEAELRLSPREAVRLAEVARADTPGADPALLTFYRVCYQALEVGRWWYASRAVPPGEERRRRESALQRYQRGLAAALAGLSAAMRRRSPRGRRQDPLPPAPGQR